MSTDYRQVCLELFGTDDVIQLERMAAMLRSKNARNAGRKRKFTEEDVAVMEKLLAEGTTINQVAKRFNTSRQIVNKYLNQKPTENRTMRLVYMYGNRPCTLIDVDFLHQKIEIQNRTNDMLHRAFGVNENPTWQDFEIFLRERCFPATRGNIKEILQEMGLTDYDPLQIIEKTKGKTAEDNLWIKFQYYPGGAHGKN